MRALIADAARLGGEAELLQAVMHLNDTQPLRMIELLRRSLPVLAGCRVAVLGLAFKPGTDDVRESPALKIAAELLVEHAHVVCHDPIALPNARAALVDQGIAVDEDPLRERSS